MNSFGELFRLTTFGESHGAAIGGVIDGMPAGMAIDTVAVQQELDRRRPGQSDIVTQRNESDRVEFLSGIYEGTSTGTPIGFIIRNADQRSNDYENMRHTWRPSHADMTYTLKYGHRDHRGGGRASARETAARVVAGALAKQILIKKGITVHAYTSRVGDIAVPLPYSALPLNDINSNPVRCPHAETANKMMELIRKVKGSGDTIGGTIQCVITGTPAGLGEPIFDKLQARLAAAMLSLPAAKGFDYGCGFDGCGELGSASIDELEPSPEGDRPRSVTNHSGGIQGGISNGEDIYFRVAFKPVATLLRPVQTVTDQLQSVTLQARGRHDPCVLPRAVPVVEAMAAMVIADALLLNQTTHLL